jgi:PKD repeat protein
MSVLPVSLILILVLASMAPLANASKAEEVEDDLELLPPPSALMPLDDFIPTEGRPYLFMDGDEPVYSATSYLKQKWWDAGSPNMFQEDSSAKGRASARACNRLTEGESISVAAYGGGTTTATVERVSNTVAFVLEDGYTLSSTVLSNWVTDWDTTIYPTLTTYFGKDYGTGVPEPPDVDGNCQIIVAIIAIDGAFNTGGFFQPGYAATREIIFIDHADSSLSWSKVILSHELQHLLHNAADSQEYLWIDEGAADMAAFLCFGSSSTLAGHSNAWTQDSGVSVRWWDQRIADYGGGFLFLLWLADHLGGGVAIRQLVTNTQTGSQGIESLAQTPPNNGGRILGSTFEEVFANFTIAATLDSSIGIHGISNIDMTDLCSGSAFCKIQPAASNADWAQPWESRGNFIEGWGVQMFKLEPGSSSPAPLSIRVTADASGMSGRILTRASSDGLYTVSDLSFSSMVATTMVPGFGNITDEVHIIVWYESFQNDCNYCSVYPNATLDIEAARITSPASLALEPQVMADRDGDGNDDTMLLPFTVTSNAFFENLNIEVSARDSNGNVTDQYTTSIEAGGGVPALGAMYWTPPKSGDYDLVFVMKDLLGDVKDQAASSIQMVHNMQPFPNASSSTNATLTWLPVQFTGSGIDYWGLTDSNNTFPHADEPTAYLWDFGDGNFSSLKSPYRGYQNEGLYWTNLSVQDQGGTWSPNYPGYVVVGDPFVPIVNVHDSSGTQVVSSITVYTNQRIQLSALSTQDNVPNDHLLFNWSWGDGEVEGGISHTVVSHEWTEGGNGNGNELTVMVTAWDGKNTGYHNFSVFVKNRLPRLVFDDVLIVDTYTSLPMPELFVDDDGELVSIDWQFTSGAAVNELNVNRNSDFTTTTSTDWQPTAAWNSPGNKTVTATVVDSDGGQSTVQLNVQVLNQWPVADIDTSDSDDYVIDFRQEDGMVDSIYSFDGRDSFDPDGSVDDSSVLSFQWFFDDGTNSTKSQVSHSFNTPGQHTVTLIVMDEDGQLSANRTLIIQIRNPLPIIEVEILDAWKNGDLVNLETPREEGFTVDSYSRTFDDENRTHASAGTLLFFDSSGTRDGDAGFANSAIPFNRNDSDWNGLIEYTWDFGDGTPPSKESHPWHSYSIPGTYVVTLTVRDAFETGDTTSASFTIIVDAPPSTDGIYAASELIIDELSIFHVNASDTEQNRNYDIYRDLNLDDGSVYDHDLIIPRDISILWDMDNQVDVDGDGNPENDWKSGDVEESNWKSKFIYEELGVVMITVKVCDGMGVCVKETLTVEINESPDKTPTLSDFKWADTKAWLSDAGGESATVLGLIIAVLIMGWMVMRTPADYDEEEAAEAANTYNVQNVESEGGVLGMDQHEPPPKPGILSKDERRSSNSGYVRPVRAKKR